MKSSPADLLGLMPWRTEVFELVQQTTTKILPSNPKRAGFYVTNTSAPGTSLNPQLNLWINEDVSAENGLVLSVSSRSALFTFKDFGPIVCQPWWIRYTVTTSSANVFLQVYEYEFAPDKMRGF